MVEPSRERRRDERLTLGAACELETDETRYQVQLVDISPSGCRFEAQETLPKGTAIILALHDEFPPVEAEVVWAEAKVHGARFSEALDAELMHALLVMSRLYGERLATQVHGDD